MEKKILIADDHDVVLFGTKLALESRVENVTIDTAGDYYQAMHKISKEKFDLIIMDINMPGTKNIKMIQEIKSIDQDMKILIFSAYEESVGMQYIKEGANGYINKLSTVDELAEAVIKIFTVGNYYPYNMVSQMFQASTEKKPLNPIETLTEKEYKIFVLFSQGLGNLEISNLMEIHTTTVSTYKRRIYKKLKVSNLAELINLYQKHNF